MDAPMTHSETIAKIRELLNAELKFHNLGIHKCDDLHEAISLLDGLERKEVVITKKQALEAAERLRYNFPKRGTNGYRWSNIVIQYILEQDGENPPSCYYAEPTPVTADLTEPTGGGESPQSNDEDDDSWIHDIDMGARQ